MSQIKVLIPSIFQALNQPSDTVYWNSGTTPGFQLRAMPDNFTQPFADNNYPRDQQEARHLFGSQMDHAFPKTNKMMNALNGEIIRHLNFMPQQGSEQQFPQRPPPILSVPIIK